MSNIKKQNQAPKDENGKRHGEWIIYHRNGELNYRYNYSHGILHGLFEWYYNNGKLGYYGYVDTGTKIGYWYWYGIKKYYLCLI